MLFLDTEGFESTGKADAYDDRIFALSAFMSAVLIYNLPETIRESDIEKLSFAVELADAFFADVSVRRTDRQTLGALHRPVAPLL
jgi:Guanylate-binding protein, N-terminal domain